MDSVRALELSFSRTFEGRVWSTLAVPGEPLLIIEVRHPDVFETSLAAWNYQTGDTLWEDVRPEEKWWVSPVAAHNGVLLLQTYKHGGNPDQKGLIALDLHRARPLWKKEGFAFHDVAGDYVLGFETTAEWQPASLHVQTGNLERGFLEPPRTGRQGAPSGRPAVYHAHTEHFDTCVKYLRRHAAVQPEETIEYLEHGDMIFLGYYVKEENKLANYLMVINGADEVVLHDRLGEGLGAETFFLLGGCLIFVKNKVQFFSYRLK